MKISAAVVESPDVPFQLDEVEIGEPRPDELLVKLVAVGMCHTDLSVRSQATPFPLPGVLGHEGAGVVVQVGAQVSDFHVGDKCGSQLRFLRMLSSLPGRQSCLLSALDPAQLARRVPVGR